ncbi:IS66 family insertion sequence element accessory protein TnpB [Ensifer adhaerens]|uniref:IS66 family insertion sequence element accessory protein TnpB n=1 Tax=Ensifer adhaerens TaxID=106592 RepID=UPI00384F5AFA
MIHAENPRSADQMIRGGPYALTPFSGHLFVFRGRSGGLIKVIWHDGQGACLFTKKLERGRFIWPSAGRRHGGDHARAARLFARRHRLANAAKNLASDVGRMSKTAGTAGANMIPSRHDRCGRSASRRPCQRACDNTVPTENQLHAASQISLQLKYMCRLAF